MCVRSLTFLAYLLVAILCQTGTAQTVDNPCINYKVMPRDKERFRNNTILPTDLNSVPCDDVMDGWYRFGTGEIARSCVPEDHCGTMSTIWMQDQIPAVGQTKLNKFCVHHDVTTTTADPCCLYSYYLNVTNCHSFLVYQMNPEHVLCPSGYCTEPAQRCPLGKSSPTGFEPCTESYPVMISPPTLGVPLITNNGKDFVQTCHINYKGFDQGVAFKVTWYFDSIHHEIVTLSNGQTSTSLTSKDWLGHIGSKLSCSVSSYFAHITNATHSPTLTSNEYFGGPQLSTSTSVIKEGQTVDVNIESTLPVICSQVPHDQCHLDIDLSVLNGSVGGIVHDGHCSVQIRASDWDPVKTLAKVATQFSAVIDPVHKPNRTYLFSIHVVKDALGHKIWNPNRNYVIRMTTQDIPHHMCMIFGDFNIFGFTHTKTRVLNSSQIEEYILYRDANSTTGKFVQVQAKVWSPTGLGSSICGIAFQYRYTLITVDMCTSDPNIAAPTLTQGERFPEDVHVYVCDSDYEIVTADGIHISIITHDFYMDVKLHIPPPYSPGEGLCANLDSTTGSTDQFRVLASLNLFAQGGRQFNTITSTPDLDPKRYCDCRGPTPDCNPFKHLSSPMSPVTWNNHGQFTLKPGCKVARPHAINPEHGESVMTTQLTRSISTFTKHAANRKCDTEIKANVPPSCVANYPQKLQEFTTICRQELLNTGEISYLLSVLQGFKWWCEEETYKRSNMYKTDVSGKLVPREDLTYCPNLCGLYGTCKHGVCICKVGYSGRDCSISSKTPVILGIKGANTCQLSNLYCFNPILVTKDVHPSDHLQAVFTLIKHELGRLIPTTTTYLLEPYYENRYSVSVPMNKVISTLQEKSAFGFNISLTTDGRTYSTPFTYIVYDDKCMDCGLIQGRCLIKENACHIEGQCHRRGDLNPHNANQTCNPDVRLMKWTDVSSSVSDQ